jgi:hypothetical protein
MFPTEISNIDSVKYLSSIGLMKGCDDNHIINYISPWKIEIDFEKVLTIGKNNSCIYIKMGNLLEFVNIIDRIPFNFILITGDGDETFPDNILSSELFINIINNTKIIKWYSTNCNENIHSKLSVIPIGLNYHCGALWNNIPVVYQESLLERIRVQSVPFYERIHKCYSNFHFSLNTNFGNPRKDAIEKIPPQLVYYEPDKISIEDTWTNQSKYTFVISPHGNGLDCHRTWEALILGCIVIVKKSVLDPLYIDLPVLIIDEWTDITDELLQNTSNIYKSRVFNYNKLTLNYWIRKIHEDINN